MAIIDADCHVIETDHTWDYLDKADRHLRPQIVNSTTDPQKQFWNIDGTLKPRPFGTAATGDAREAMSGFSATTEAARKMDDIDARLAHMDELGVDVQVLYPTIYLTQISSKPAVDLALAKSYNRWMADIWRRSNGRLRWVAVPPLMTMDATLSELRIAKENGACGVFMRGFEGDRLLTDPYFFPLYDEASDLDMPICIHAGCGNPAFAELVDGEAYSGNKLPVLSAFHSLLFRGIPDRFPKLRFGFVEVAAQWLPYFITDLTRRLERDGKTMKGDPLGDNRMYVACQTNDDLPHILSYVGEDNLVIGSDYGHSDTSSELEALRRFKNSGEVDARVVDKILDDNPARLYGI